jgi:hypothetical protein
LQISDGKWQRVFLHLELSEQARRSFPLPLWNTRTTITTPVIVLFLPRSTPLFFKTTINMSFLLLLLFSCIQLFGLVPALPFSSYDYGSIDRSTILKRQLPPSPYVVTGVHTGAGSHGSLPLRLEIREMEQDPTTWTLYILGLDMLQYTNQTEMLSWYQITGMPLSHVSHSSINQFPRNPWSSLHSF